jgi:hypothetical protein
MVVGRIAFHLHRFEDVALLSDGQIFPILGRLQASDSVSGKAYLGTHPHFVRGAVAPKSPSRIARILTSVVGPSRKYPPFFEIFDI